MFAAEVSQRCQVLVSRGIRKRAARPVVSSGKHNATNRVWEPTLALPDPPASSLPPSSVALRAPFVQQLKR